MHNEILNLVKSNPGQLSISEYSALAKMIESKRPCNLLIFGLGNDSSFWLKLNQGGKTVFIEDNKQWFDAITKKVSVNNAVLVNYNSTRKDYLTLLKQPEQLEIGLPSHILNTKWDIIFVDGPSGYNDNTPGRMKSIYTASKLAYLSGNTYVFVHDCDRKVEKLYCDSFLSDPNMVNSIEKLRVYFINSE
jgi:glucuronoxylan 4-O-methyltransferase